MSTQESGIILKSFLPYQAKLSVFTKTKGKITLLVYPQKNGRNFSAGMRIHYFPLRQSGAHAHGGQIEIVSIPLENDSDHIYWLHHVCEICYYFAPLGMPSPEVYQCLRQTLVLEQQEGIFAPYFDLVKRICITKLFVLLGFFPQASLIPMLSLFDYVVALSLDSSDAQKVRSLQVLFNEIPHDFKKEMALWAVQCIEQHPCAAQFKTMAFLDKV